MAEIIFILGALQIFGGVGALIAAKSAIHEILGTLGIGTGIISLALAVVIWHLARIRRQLHAFEEIARTSRAPAAHRAEEARESSAETFSRQAR